MSYFITLKTFQFQSINLFFQVYENLDQQEMYIFSGNLNCEMSIFAAGMISEILGTTRKSIDAEK